MKKTYLRPEMQATEIELQQVMAGSILNLDNSNTANFSDQEATEDAYSRRHSLWDVED